MNEGHIQLCFHQLPSSDILCDIKSQAHKNTQSFHWTQENGKQRERQETQEKKTDHLHISQKMFCLIEYRFIPVLSLLTYFH